MFNNLKKIGYKFPSIVSPLAYVSPQAKIGEGTIVMHGAIVNRGAIVGNNTIINTKALVEHDAIVGNNCHIATGSTLNGGALIGNNSFIGIIIYLLMMAAAFMGYVLPWGQMSFWGATVITNLFSAIPLVGEGIVTWLWGGYSVDNPTLTRFFTLHYLIPFLIFMAIGPRLRWIKSELKDKLSLVALLIISVLFSFLIVRNFNTNFNLSCSLCLSSIKFLA